MYSLKNTEMNNNEFIIFASDSSDAETQEYLKGGLIGFKALKGSYVMESGEKVVETSYIVNSDNMERLGALIKGQESILLLSSIKNNGKRIASLLFTKTQENVKLGQFVSVSESEALAQDNWTYDPQMDLYFIVKD